VVDLSDRYESKLPLSWCQRRSRFGHDRPFLCVRFRNRRSAAWFRWWLNCSFSTFVGLSQPRRALTPDLRRRPFRSVALSPGRMRCVHGQGDQLRAVGGLWLRTPSPSGTDRYV